MRMDRRGFLAAAASFGAGVASTRLGGQAQAQPGHPLGPVTIYVPFAAGGASDVLTRTLAGYARSSRSIAVEVEFRPGAGGTLGPSHVAKAAPDGGSLGFYSVSPFIAVPHLQTLPYRTLTDFTFLAAYAYIPIALYVPAGSALNSWYDLLRFGKDHPGALRWGTAGTRGVAHLAVEAAFRKEGIASSFVPFSGGSEAIKALLDGHLDAVVSADYGPHLAAGRVRLLAFTGSETIAGQEALPTFKQLNYPLATEALYGLFGPAGLRQHVAAYWEALVQEMTGSDAYTAALKAASARPIFLGSADFTANVVENYHRHGEQIKLLGLESKG